MTAAQRALVASAPTRLDFGGGWTDVPPYPEERGGFVCNLAIDRLATVTLRGPSSPGGQAAPAVTPPLAAAAIRRAGLTGVAATIDSDFPVGSGLGGSSAAGVALAAALAAYQDEAVTPAALAMRSRAVETEELGIAGGWQDHYAAAFGGALGLTFDEATTVEQIALPPGTAAALERRCILAYTGESRISAATITAVLDGYAARHPRVVGALERMKSLAIDMAAALRHGDVDALAALVDEHWTHQRSLHPGITTARIDALESAARSAGATGMKALGASGGGCVIVFAGEEEAPQVRDAVAPFATVMEWRVAAEGVRVKREGDA